MSEDVELRSALAGLVDSVEDVAPGLAGQVRRAQARRRRRTMRLTVVGTVVAVTLVVVATDQLTRQERGLQAPATTTPSPISPTPSVRVGIVPSPTVPSQTVPSSVAATPTVTATATATMSDLARGRYFVTPDGPAGSQRLLLFGVFSGKPLASLPLPHGATFLSFAPAGPGALFVLTSTRSHPTSASLVRIAVPSGRSTVVATSLDARNLADGLFTSPDGGQVASARAGGGAVLIDTSTGKAAEVGTGSGQLVGWTPDGNALEWFSGPGDRVLLRHIDGTHAGTITPPRGACGVWVLGGVVFALTQCGSQHALLMNVDTAGVHLVADIGALPSPRLTSRQETVDGQILVLTSPLPKGCDEEFVIDLTTGVATASGPPSDAAAAAAGCLGISRL
ncbi:MAG: hypothetical protein QOJ11_3774 [Frankiales bacterium]|jgi:hypothetical protein|nr:hypothetical protein [Frankiales bacterium]